MIKYLHALKKYFLLRAHKKYINSNFIVGNNFMEYPNVKPTHILNFKLQNRTNDKNKVKIGNYCNTSISGFVNKNGSVKIGDYVYMGNVQIRIDYNLRIGNYCLFADQIKLWDTDNHPLSASKRKEQAIFMAEKGFIDSYQAQGGDITIEDNVWVCMNSIIMGGVTIGKGSIVAAGSIVTKNVPPMTIVGGVPAKIIGVVPD